MSPPSSSPARRATSHAAPPWLTLPDAAPAVTCARPRTRPRWLTQECGDRQDHARGGTASSWTAMAMGRTRRGLGTRELMIRRDPCSRGLARSGTLRPRGQPRLGLGRRHDPRAAISAPPSISRIMSRPREPPRRACQRFHVHAAWALGCRLDPHAHHPPALSGLLDEHVARGSMQQRISVGRARFAAMTPASSASSTIALAENAIDDALSVDWATRTSPRHGHRGRDEADVRCGHARPRHSFEVTVAAAHGPQGLGSAPAAAGRRAADRDPRLSQCHRSGGHP